MAESKFDAERNIISSDDTDPAQLSAYDRWELPALDLDLPEPNAKHALRIHEAKQRARKPTAAEPEPEPDDEDEDLTPPTAEELEAIRQAAYDEGMETGLASGQEAGYKAGFDKGMGEAKSIATRMAQICQALLEPIPAQDEALENVLLQLVETMCKRVVQRELLADSTQVVDIVREALQCLKPGTERVRIHLNPDDVKHVTEALEAVDELDPNWRILPHKTISPGGCIVDTDSSLVDMRAEKRLGDYIRQVYAKLDVTTVPQAKGGQHNLQQVFDEVPGFGGDDDMDDADEAGPINE